MKTFNFYITLLTLLFSSICYSQWYPQSSGITTNLYSIFSIDGTTAWMTGANGVILKTTNRGASWVQKPSGVSYSISFIHFFNQNEGIIAGSGGTIKKSYDGGETWESISSGTYNRLQEGCFVNDSVGYVVGDAGILLKTINRGNSWTNSVIAPENFSFIYFVNENTGFATTEWTGQIWKTTDAGVNWSLKQIIGNYSIWQVHFVDVNNGWVVGEYGTIAHTTDSGETWNLQYSGTGVNMRSIYFHTPNIGWAVGKDEKRLRTIDGGDTWIHDHTGYSNEFLYIFFIDDNIGWICGTGGVILLTENNGIPVELVNFSGGIEGNYIVLHWTTATELNNSGFEVERKYENQFWLKIGFVPGNGTTTEKKFYQFGDQPKKIGKYSYRLKQIDYDGTFEYSDEISIDFNTQYTFVLEQNYPNPFNPSTTIRYQIPNSSFVTLKVYDVLGNEISTLVNEKIPAGSYEFDFDATGLPSGIYLYRLQAGDFVDTRKMILIK
jgi:photosystem II stability/assembly factor-like uncharacterized protein